jgi:hypothetical protein
VVTADLYAVINYLRKQLASLDDMIARLESGVEKEMATRYARKKRA